MGSSRSINDEARGVERETPTFEQAEKRLRLAVANAANADTFNMVVRVDDLAVILAHLDALQGIDPEEGEPGKGYVDQD